MEDVPLLLLLLTAFAAEKAAAPAKPAFTPQRFTACELVTRADVEKALGQTIDSVSENNQPAASTCDYSTKFGLVSIAVQKLPAKPNRDLEIAALKQEMPEGSVRETPAIPDAFYFDIPEAGTQLHIVDGDRRHLMISILGLGEPPQVSPAAERLARKALGRM